MPTITIKKGLNIPIAGQPDQTIHDAPAVKSVAILGRDYVGMRATMMVSEGDQVKLGQPLFSDKKLPGVVHVSPAAGKVVAINRGARRMLQSVVIELDGDEQLSFQSYSDDELQRLSPDDVREQLQKSGLWTSFRTRPYSKVPLPSAEPNAIFVNAMDTRPLAADPMVVISEYPEDFRRGLQVLSQLTKSPIYVTTCPEETLPLPAGEQVQQTQFSGPHPAGLPGTHMHFVSPVTHEKPAWHLHYQDTIAIGKLFTSGKIWVDRIISLAGPMVEKPRLVRTRMGANIDELIHDEVKDQDIRPISGSILGGRRALGTEAYLGRYHLQVSVLEEGKHREFMGWIIPSRHKFSVLNVFLSALDRASGQRLNLTTSQNGSPRAMVPFGQYERIMPLDILPSQLLRALLVRDTDTAQALGCLELDEEDLALCSFVCAGKSDYGPILRENLTQIEKEG